MSSPKVAMPSESKKALDISNLMSPPELTPLDQFTQASSTMTPIRRTILADKPSIPAAPLSPPISPFTKGNHSIDSVPSSITVIPPKDPILYPNSDVSSSPPRPLFNDDHSMENRRVVEKHLASRSPILFREATPPQREEYELALYFKSEIMKQYTRDPKRWLRKEREHLLADRKAIASRTKQHQPMLAAKPSVARPAAPRVTKPDKIRREIIARPPRIAPQTTARPRQSSVRAPSATPEPRSRPVPPNREDKDFNSIADYCPPLESLPQGRGNSLKVDWKGNPLDLTNDPHLYLLHPDERILAAGLRLDCATYLTSKRRIFERRLECARIPKEFRKTDAQQACKIDVNKASKLWTAYEKVGWLDLKWMNKFLHLPN